MCSLLCSLLYSEKQRPARFSVSFIMGACHLPDKGACGKKRRDSLPPQGSGKMWLLSWDLKDKKKITKEVSVEDTSEGEDSASQVGGRDE